MSIHLPSRSVLVVIAIMFITFIGVLWFVQDIQTDSEIRPAYINEKYISFTEQGNAVAQVYVRPWPQPDFSHAVPVQVMLELNHSRFRVDSYDIRLTRKESGDDIYCREHSIELPARFYRERNKNTYVMSVQTPGWWGESNQAEEFFVPLVNKSTEDLMVDVDARLSEKGLPFRHYRIRSSLPVSINLSTVSIS